MHSYFRKRKVVFHVKKIMFYYTSATILFFVLALQIVLGTNKIMIQAGRHEKAWKLEKESLFHSFLKSRHNTDKLYVKESIRVVIKTDGFEKIYHEKVVVNAASQYRISSGNHVISVGAGTEFEITSDAECWKEKSIVIEADDKSEITLCSVKRNGRELACEGKIQLYLTDRGIVVVNELLLEQYLNWVVASEMPQSYGENALMAQAVCARSYACRHMENPGYPEYEADVDDSTSYQVYHNANPSENVIDAVNRTKGQVAVYKGEIIMAYFFSTSCGHTTDAQIWGDERIPYLCGVNLEENHAYPKLEEEGAMREYLRNVSTKTYDSMEPWYRWSAKLDMTKLSEEWKEKLGEISRISVEKRGTGGVVKELLVCGEKGKEKIQSEYDIRKFLGSTVTELTKNDNTKGNTGMLLPSGYFVLEKEDYPEMKLLGGGFGHGAGMSQNAAKNMAAKGMKYEQILQTFYPGTSLATVVYSD